MYRSKIRSLALGAALVVGAWTLAASSGRAQAGHGNEHEIGDHWGRPNWSSVQQDRQCQLVQQNSPALGCYLVVAGSRCATWTRLIGIAPRLRTMTVCVHG